MITFFSSAQLQASNESYNSSNAIKVLLLIDLNHSSEVCKYLVEQNIEFTMSFNNIVKTTTSSRNSLPSVRPSKIPSTMKEKIIAAFEKYAINEPHLTIPTIQQVAHELEVAPRTFKHQFNNFYGKSFLQMILEQRFKLASELLLKGYNGTQVSQMIGYGSKSAIKFNKMFQKYYGKTPKQFQLINAR